MDVPTTPPRRTVRENYDENLKQPHENFHELEESRENEIMLG